VGTLSATMNLSLDGCCHHTQVIADDEFHARMVELFGGASALLFGRNTYELLRDYWPEVAASGSGTPSETRLARVLNEKPKYVASSHEPAGGWNARRVHADRDSLRALRREVQGTLLLVASPTLARALLEWNLVDEYYIAVSPMVAGHGPTFMAGLQQERAGTLLDVTRLQSGVVIHRYAFGGHPSAT
jgi:dihydrofolate reductase